MNISPIISSNIILYVLIILAAFFISIFLIRWLFSIGKIVNLLDGIQTELKAIHILVLNRLPKEENTPLPPVSIIP